MHCTGLVRITGQVKFLCNSSVTTLNDIEFYKSISSENSGNCDPKFETQRTAQWFNARKGKSMKAIMTAKALGWFGKKAMIEWLLGKLRINYFMIYIV